MEIDLTVCNCGKCPHRLVVHLRGHVYTFEFLDWRQLAVQLISYRDNKALDFGDVDCFAVNYYLGVALQSRSRYYQEISCPDQKL